MSCSLTVDAVKARTKTVTRRKIDTWQKLKPGERLTLIEKGMGLPKGAKQVVLGEVEIVDVRLEQLADVDDDECRYEGFPEMHTWEFIGMWLESHNVHLATWSDQLNYRVRRIEWRYLP